jgi:two-component system LytT family response regulator
MVFVTAYDQYSLKAFEEKTLKYQLKLEYSTRLAKTVTKLLEIISDERGPVYGSAVISRISCLLGNRVR